MDDDRADRNLVFIKRLPRLCQGQPHPVFVRRKGVDRI
jgi:hypothetical protein